MSALELKVDIPPINVKSATEAQNSQWSFLGVCGVLGVKHVLTGETEGTEEQEQTIERALRRWTGRDPVIVASLRTAFGMEGGNGTDMYDHVLEHFIKPMVNELADAEAELDRFDWDTLFTSDPTVIKALMDTYINLVARQPRQPENGDKYWITYVLDRMPYDFANAVQWHLQHESMAVQMRASTSLTAFAVEISKAKNDQLRREARGGRTLAAPPGLGGAPASSYSLATNSTTMTPGVGKCGLAKCPTAKNKEWKCDVLEDLGAGRINTLTQNFNKEHRAEVDAARKAKGRPAIDYSQAAQDGWRVGSRVNVHAMLETDGNPDDDADLDAVLAEMTSRWHQSDMQLEQEVTVRECACCIHNYPEDKA